MINILKTTRIKNKQYVNTKILVNQYLGYKKPPKTIFNGLSTLNQNGKQYIVKKDALNLIKTKYNKRNPMVIDIHEALGIKTQQYSIEASTLNPIVKYLQKNNIKYELQHKMGNRRIDLFLPFYKIAIECNEGDHINYDPDDVELRTDEILLKGIELFSYNPHEKNFDITKVIKQLEKVINTKKLSNFTLENAMELLKEYDENSLEGKYYQLVGQSLITNDFVIDFDDVWKLCGYARKGDAKVHLVKNFEENTDYIHLAKSKKILKTQKGGQIKKIYITGDCFKMFCMSIRTNEAIKIRKWYVEMEIKYKNLLINTIKILQNDKNKIVNSVNKNTINRVKDKENKKQNYKSQIKKTHKKTELLLDLMNAILYVHKHDVIDDITDFKITSIELNEYSYDILIEDKLDEIKDVFGIKTIRFYDRKRTDCYVLTLLKTMTKSCGSDFISKPQTKKVGSELVKWTNYVVV